MDATKQVTYRRIGWVFTYASVIAFFTLCYFILDGYQDPISMISLAIVWLITSAIASVLLCYARAPKCVSIQYGVMPGYLLLILLSFWLIKSLGNNMASTIIMALDLWLSYAFGHVVMRLDHDPPWLLKFFDLFILLVSGFMLIIAIDFYVVQYHAKHLYEEMVRVAPARAPQLIIIPKLRQDLWMVIVSGLMTGLFIPVIVYKYRGLVRWRKGTR